MTAKVFRGVARASWGGATPGEASAGSIGGGVLVLATEREVLGRLGIGRRPPKLLEDLAERVDRWA